ncbi:hypothetical protein ACZ90_06970 [Streptomyces albus subsp. albus]|nr:hypothetical protein ACZ90_06970 [Streptomyces albus subsp. albus]
MTPIRRTGALRPPLLPAAALAALTALTGLTACGTEPSTGGGTDRGELQRRAEALQTRLDMVYVTEADGFALAEQSVGVYGDHGYQAAYVRAKGGAVIQLTVDEGRAGCAAPGFSQAGGGKPDCRADGGQWYRSTARTHEYVLGHDGHVVRLSADRAAVDRDTLREAARAAHQADDAELADTLPEARHGGTGPGPIERGDLPPNGDGAPVDPVDPEHAGG